MTVWVTLKTELPRPALNPLVFSVILFHSSLGLGFEIGPHSIALAGL